MSGIVSGVRRIGELLEARNKEIIELESERYDLRRKLREKESQLGAVEAERDKLKKRWEAWADAAGETANALVSALEDRDKAQSALRQIDDRIPCEDDCPSVHRVTDAAHGKCTCEGGRLRKIVYEALK